MAVKPIIIRLEADPSGLTPGIEALEALGAVDKQAADQFKASTKAFQDQGKAIDQTASSAAKFADAASKIGDAAIGGAIKQGTENVRKLNEQLKNIPVYLRQGGMSKDVDSLVKQFKAGEVQVDALSTSIALVKKRLQELDPQSTGFKSLENELKASVVANELLNKSFTSTRSELRAMREALTQLEEAGLENTKVFENLAVAAGQMDDQLGDTQARIKALASDTFELDAGIQVVQGLAGSFAVAQGAAALFGDESEQVQKILLKVNAAMAILQGLQQIQNILQRESTLSIAANIALQRISVLQTDLQAAAESRFIVVRYAAIVAQKALNAVMALNPAGAVLLAIGALAAGVYLLTNRTTEAEKQQKRYNEQLKKTQESLKYTTELVNGLADGYQTEIDILEASGASQDKIAAATRKSILQRLDDQRKLQKQLIGQIGVEDEYSESVRKSVQLRGELRKFEAEQTKQAFDGTNKSAVAAAEARISQAKKNSQSELEAQIAAAKVSRDVALSDVNITQGERLKIIADTERKIADITLQIQQKSFDDQIALAEAKALEQEDNYSSIQARIREITLKFDRDRIGASRDQEIELERQKNEDIIKVYQERRGAFAEIEEQIVAIILRAQRDMLGKSAEQRVLLETQANEEIRQLRLKFLGDLENAQRDHNATLNKLDKDRVLASAALAQQELQAKQQQHQDELASKGKQLENEKNAQRAITEQSINLAGSLASSLTEIAQNSADQQIAIEQQRLEQGLISQEQFDQRSRAIKRRAAQQEKALAIFQAQLALSLAILSVLKDQTIPAPLKPIFIALATAQALVQTAAIASKPIPAFKMGTKDAPGGPSLVGEAGPELIYHKGNWQYASKATVLDLPKHAKVIPTLETQQILSKYSIPLPNVSQNVSTSVGQVKIDYNKLGQAVGREIGKLPLQVNRWDERGYASYQSSISSRQADLNSKYSSPRK